MPKEENIDFVTLSNDIDYVANILSNIGSKETNMRNILSNLDAQEQDLLHEVELVDLSRSEKTAYVTKLQEVRQKRRKVKNIIELIEPVSKLVKTNSKIVYELSSVSSKIKDTLKMQSTRVYTPKARTDLKIIKNQKMNARFDKNGKVIVTTEGVNKNA